MEEVKTCEKSGSLILSAQILTPIGQLTLESCAKGFHSISFTKSPPLAKQPLETHGKLLECKYSFPPEHGSKYTEAKNNVEKEVEWIENYFENPEKDTPGTELIFSQFCLDGATEFEISVWRTLFESVKFGQTTSYAKLAGAINNPKAARAVGTALKKNPILLMIPCHRVIRSDGTLGSFAGGRWNECKEYLCRHENHAMAPCR